MMEATFSVTTIITEEYVHPTSECVCRSVGINTEDMMNDSIDFAVNGARAVIRGTLRDRWGQVRTEFCDTVDTVDFRPKVHGVSPVTSIVHWLWCSNIDRSCHWLEIVHSANQ
jgi:hypothetical protein